MYINTINFLLLIILILNFFNKRRFINRINTLYKFPSILNVRYLYDYYMNKNKHYLNLKKLVKNEIDQHDLNDVEKENIINLHHIAI